MTSPQQAPDKLLTVQEAAAFLGVEPARMKFWRINRQKGIDPKGPQYVKLGYRTVKYAPSDLQAFVEMNKHKEGAR